MTVLWEGPNEPPRKRVCLSTSSTRRNVKRHSQQLPLANASSSVSHCTASPLNSGVMMNGYLSDSLHHHGLKNCSPDESPGSDSQSPIATLCNLGNTCFLNSVLYTLRFAPSFLHNLHHLAEDLKHYSARNNQLKSKSASLGRSIGSACKSSNSSKDLSSLGDNANAKIQLATEKLHDLYESLHDTEQKDHMEAFQPEIFLHALRDVNPIFEGNQQHDAHELLVCLLDNIRETCRQLSQLVEHSEANGTVAPLPPKAAPANSLLGGTYRKSLKMKVTKRKKSSSNDLNKKIHDNEMNNLMNGTDGSIERNGLPDGLEEKKEQGPVTGHNFIADDFEGVTLLRTTCLECEMVTERKETFCDICVPIDSNSSVNNNNHGTLSEQDINKLYKGAVVTEEYLHETNKYWCETCLRYNEAKRSVRYESLPRLLTLQLKRFSSSFGSVVSKVIDFMPTPLNLSCFCEECSHQPNESQHRYQLFGVIMHLGATMASGHYVAYVRGRDVAGDYEHCTRGKRKTASLSGGSGKHANPNTEKPKFLDRIIKNLGKKTPSNGGSNSTVSNESARNQLFYQSCRSADCCGLRIRGCEDSSTTKNDLEASSWLECDDDTVRNVSKTQMEEILTGNKNSKNSALTPYLLFYVRSNQ